VLYHQFYHIVDSPTDILAVFRVGSTIVGWLVSGHREQRNHIENLDKHEETNGVEFILLALMTKGVRLRMTMMFIMSAKLDARIMHSLRTLIQVY